MTTNNGLFRNGLAGLSEDEDEPVPEYKPDWLAPTFAENFQAVRCQQGNDAAFVGVLKAKPKPEVSWTHNGRSLNSTDKCQLDYDPTSGRVSLVIRDLGPGDEGQYCCTASNDYGSITATLSINPDINNVQLYRTLSRQRASLQRKRANHTPYLDQQLQLHDGASTADYDYGSVRSASGMTL